MTTANEFVKSYIALWGEDEVEHLFAQGYEPVCVSVETAGSLGVKWVWLQIELNQVKPLTPAAICAIV